MVGIRIKDQAGVVLIYGLSSQPVALHLCNGLKAVGIKATIGMIPGMPGYQVSVYQLSIDEVKAALGKMGIEADEDGV